MDENPRRPPKPPAIEYAGLAFVVALFVSMIIDHLCNSGILLQSSVIVTTLGAGIVLGIIRWINRTDTPNDARNSRRLRAVVFTIVAVATSWILLQIGSVVLQFMAN